jgi:uncharacterized protein (TIGR00255 family)
MSKARDSSIRSMTGFGRASLEQEGLGVDVEIRSVNNRYLTFKCRLPAVLLRHEKELEERVRKRASRGSFDVFVRLRGSSSALRPVVDADLARQYVTALQAFLAAEGYGERLSAEFVLGLPGVVTAEEEERDGAVFTTTLETFGAALAALLAMRQAEGARLSRELEKRCRAIERLVERIHKRAPLVPREYQKRYQERMRQLLAEGPVSPEDEGVRREVAYFAERADISEEIERLRAHVEHLRELLAGGGPVGRSLEFVVQEMGRETNTIGAKASDIRISRDVVALKAELEKIREQVQNIE